MKNAARLLLLLALVGATARAAPTSKLTSEWFVPLDSDSGRFALVDTATGAIRIGIMNPDGKTGFSQVVPTGITEVSDAASGILGAQGEEIVLTAPAANRVIRVTAAAEFPLAYVFQPLGGLGTSGASESESAAARKLLISSLANAPANISKLELRDPLTGALITELNSTFLVQRLEPMTNPADGNRVSIGVNTTASGTIIRVSQPPENRLIFSSSQPHEILTDVIGSAGGRHFIAFRNGFAAARIFTAALPITKTSSFSSASVNFPFPVSALLRVPGGADSPLTDGVIALAADGTQALWLRVNATGNGFITTPHTFTPDPGSALTGLLPLPQGVVQLSGAQAGGVSTDFKGMAFDGTNWVVRSSGSLPPLPAANAAAATLLFMDRDPFISNGARVVGMQSVPDWTRRTNSEARPESVVREIFQGSAAGLRFNSTQTVTSPPGTNFVIANQADPALSVVTLGTAASVFTPSLRVEPPSGSYEESFQVTATFDAKAFKLRFRRDAGPWQDWAGPLPVAYTTTLQFALQSLTGGAPGPVQTRSYLFTANKLLAQDSDGDGVPDFVELQKGLDPFGGADHDGDGISDLDELIRGTNPADANDPPRDGILETPGGNSPVLRGAGLRMVALPFDVQGRRMNIEQPVQLRTLTGGLLAEANTSVFSPKLPDNTDFGARLSTSASVPVQELVALSSPESFRTGTETVGREIIRFVPADPPPQLSVAVTPTGTNLAGDVNAWITAAQAAASAVPFAPVRTRLDPPDMAVSVLLEHLIHSALTVVRPAENPAPPLEDFSLFSGRTNDGGRLRLNENDKVMLITRGFEFRKAVTQSQNRRTAMSSLANGIYARHSAATNPPGLEMPLDILRSVLRGADLPPEYAGAATTQQITDARAAYNGAVAAALGNFRESESIEVQIPSTFLGQGVYLGDIGGELEPVVLFRLGRRFFLDQEFGAQPGTRFLITAFTDLPLNQGRVALDVTAVQFLSNPLSLDRDSDSNGLDDEWERFFFGAIGQNPGFIPPGHTKTLAQLFASGEDPRALALEPDILVEQPAGNALAPLAAVNFGVMGLNSSQNLVFTVRNIGRADLTGLGIIVAGEQAGSFSVTLEPLTPVTPQGQSTFTVRFRPQTEGAHSATMFIASNDPDENPFAVPLTGTGVIVGRPHPGFSPVIGSANIIALATQPDGKILVGGLLSSVNGQAVGNLARLNPDGTLDTSFNTGTGASSSVICVSVLSDEKILVGGNFTQFNGATATRIVRLNSNGSIDGSFSAAFSGGVGTVTGIVPQTDGRLIVVGNYTSANGQPRNRIVRLFSNGALDGSFNPGSGADNNIRNAVVQPDGRIVIMGDFANVNGQARNRLARLNADGSLESTAGFNPGTGPNGIVRALSLLPDGQIMIGGDFATVDGFPRPGLAILSASGQVTAFTCSGLAFVSSFIRQTDGKVIIGGSFTSVGGSSRNRIARISPATSGGSSFAPDTTFNVGSGANGTVNAVALAANGSVIAGGTFSTMNALPRSGLAVLVNESPATNITVTADNRILWSRSGTAPEIAEAEFDVSGDGGAIFTPLGTAQFIAGGWQMTGVENLPDEGIIRVRAALRTGQGNSSAGLVQTAAPFSLNASSIPFISSIAAVTTNEDTPAGPFSFTVSDVHTAADRLLVSAVSSNATLLPASGIALGGAGGQRTLTLTPAQDQFGTATITVRAFDGARTGTNSFTFTVLPVNDVPEISPIPDQFVALNSPIIASFAVSDVETPAESLIVTGTSSNTAVVPLDGILLTGGSKREVRITHAPNAVGSSTITLTVSDGAATAQTSFQVTVNNNAPVISKVGDVTLNEDFTITALTFTVSDNETPAASLVVEAESSNPVLLAPATLGVFGSGGTRFISILPGPNLHGTAVVTLRVSDGLQTTETSFTVTVLPVNDAPFITPIANLSTLEDTPVTIPISVTDVDGPVTVLGAFQVNPQPGAAHTLSVNQAERTLLITPPLDFHGTATFTVTVNDSRLSDSTTFTLTVLPVNDAPSFTKGPDFSHPFGFDVPQVVENWATEMSAGPANESGQSLSFVRLSVSQPQPLTLPFFAAVPTVTPDGRLSYRTRGLAGTSTIRLVIEDDGGAENGGVDRSVEQTFTITVGDAESRLVIEDENGQVLEEGTGLLNFGSVAPGGSIRRQLIVRNAGEAALNFGGLIKGTGLERFIIAPVQPGVLEPGQTRLVQIAFAPETSGAHTGVLTFLSDDPVEARRNYSITLTGGGASAPTVRLLRPNSVTRQSIDLNAIVNAGHANTTVTVDLGTTINYGITVPASPPLVTGGDDTPVRAVASGLQGGTLYFYRVRAQNAAGVRTAEGVFFTETNSAGAFDESFRPQVDANGRVLALAVQPDGKIWAGGDYTEINGTPCTALARLNPDGSLDKIFNLRNEGSPILPEVRAIVVQPDGRVVVGGLFNRINDTPRHLLARLNPDGTLDDTFSFVTFSAGPRDSVLRLLLQTDGSLIVGGRFSTVNGTARTSLARLTATGVLDTAFAPSLGGQLPPEVLSMALQEDGRVLIGGLFATVNGLPHVNLARLHADGFPDQSFNARMQLNLPFGEVNSILVRPEGGILVGGARLRFLDRAPGVNDFLAALREDGSVDDGFTLGIEFAKISSAIVSGPLPSRLDIPTITDLASQADGSVVVAGNFTLVANGRTLNNITRLLPGGALDADFQADVPARALECLALQADGRILIGGFFTSVNGEPQLNLARLLNDAPVESMRVVDGNRVEWLRGGAIPEAQELFLDVSTDGGIAFQELGRAARIPGGWALVDATLAEQDVFHIRSRARLISGGGNGSAGWMQSVIAHNQPDIEILVLDGPELVDAVSTHDFGPSLLTSSVTQTFIIHNTGPLPLQIGAITVDGAAAADYTVSTTGMSTTLETGDITTFDVTFVPGAIGFREAVLRVASNDPDAESSFDVDFIGEGVLPGPPQMVIKGPDGATFEHRAKLDLGAVLKGQTSGFVFTIENQGFAPLTGLAISKISGGSGFSFTPVESTAISRGQSTTFLVSFKPANATPQSLRLRLASNDAAKTPFEFDLRAAEAVRSVVVDFNGTRLNSGAASLQNLGSNLTFGVPVQRTFNLVNTGNVPFVIANLVLDHPDFQVSAPGKVQLAPGGDSTPFTVTFTPRSGGLSRTSLQVLSNEKPQSFFDLRLQGGILAQEIAVEQPTGVNLVSGTSIVDFGTPLAGGRVVRIFTLRNTGTSALSIGTSSFVGTAPFTLTKSPSSLAAGKSMTFEVTFAPLAGGDFAGTLLLPNNDADENPFIIELRGSALPALLPVITRQPVSLIVPLGSPVVFDGDAASDTALSFQWQRGLGAPSNFGKALASAPLRIAKVTLNDASNYRFQAINAFGPTNSESARLVVMDTKVSTFSPTLGRSLSLRLNLAGPGPLELLWQKDGVPLAVSQRITSVTGQDLVINNLTTTDSGIYTCVVTTPQGVRT